MSLLTRRQEEREPEKLQRKLTEERGDLRGLARARPEAELVWRIAAEDPKAVCRSALNPSRTRNQRASFGMGGRAACRRHRCRLPCGKWRC